MAAKDYGFVGHNERYEIISFVNTTSFYSDDLAETLVELERLLGTRDGGYGVYDVETGWLTPTGEPGGKPPWERP